MAAKVRAGICWGCDVEALLYGAYQHGSTRRPAIWRDAVIGRPGKHDGG